MGQRFQVPNLSYIRSDDLRYAQTIQALAQGLNNISDQGNLDPSSSQLATPTPISSMSVVEANGIHDIQITDNSPAYNGLKYRATYSQTPDFQNSHIIDMGESQNHRANLGAGTYYWHGQSKYPGSQPSAPVYHGGATPSAVGSGTYAGPAMQAGQSFAGSYRNSTTPPVRK